MSQNSIHVEAKGEGDLLVREDGGRELGHYLTQAEAKEVGHKLARKRRVELVVHDQGGRVQRSRPRKGWFVRIFGR